MSQFFRQSIRLGALAALGMLCCSVATPVAAAPDNAAPPMTSDDVAAFVDGIMSQRIERDDIAGGVMAIVKDGHVLFEKGYGYADVEKRLPVRPDQTLFGIGSISKTFTGTAVMQLVEKGSLDLDVDVQKYLDFDLRRNFPEPITLRRLLTHTAGFEENGKDADDPPDAITKLGEFLRTHQSAQIFHPGTRVAYSNYGVSLAGYIVEHVSGQPFAAYVAEHIYQPLDMAHSTFEAPLPADLAPLASKAYWLASQSPQLEYRSSRPAGGMYSTADDMTRFMIAHLQNGQYSDRRILTEASAQAMHTIQWRGHPDAGGIGINFYQVAGNGRFVLAHGGDITCQHSYMWLIPSENLGVFVAFNSAGTDWTRLRGVIWQSLLDRYYPPAAGTLPTDATGLEEARSVAGTYLTTRRAQTTFLSITSYLGPTRVTANADASISVEGLNHYNGTPRKFWPVGNLLFREADGSGHIVAFVTAPADGTQLMIVDSVAEFERQTGLLAGRTPQGLVLGAAGFLTLFVLGWPIGAFARWRLKPAGAAPAYSGRLLVRAIALAALALYGLAGLYVRALANLDLAVLSSRMDQYLRGFQLLALLVVIGTGFVLWRCFAGWRTREGSVWHRIALTLLSLSLLATVLIIASYHLLAIDLSF
jgi:CubicO group peptidase (beta-lactamase class C family)